MSAEDALFRVMVPVAEALLEKELQAGGPSDPGAIAEMTVREFAQTLDLKDYAEALRARLVARLQQGPRAAVARQPTDRRTT